MIMIINVAIIKMLHCDFEKKCKESKITAKCIHICEYCTIYLVLIYTACCQEYKLRPGCVKVSVCVITTHTLPVFVLDRNPV